MKCTYSYHAGVRRTDTISPTGECLREPTGAFVGQKSMWPFCSIHEHDVVELVTEHCDTREFPLTKVDSDVAKVWEVMES